ncbi:MAG: DUF1080 domain-containing protein [Planctomycetota bacterium]
MSRLHFLVLTLVIFSVVASAQSAPAEPRLAPDESVFDGTSLEGWVTRGGRYDGTARWTVEEGAIVGRQGPNKSGGLIYTERHVRNGIISFETRIDYPFDSGVFLRMAPPGAGKGFQVTLDARPGGEVGVIYADGFLAHNEAGLARFRRDDWNRVTVRWCGAAPRITAWLNGELLCDYTLPAEAAKDYAPTGLVGLQVHGGEQVPDSQSARFRSIRLRELPEFDPALFRVDDAGQLHATPAGASAGWTRLFDGESLEGWEPIGTKPADYVAGGGVLAFPKSGGDGYLRTLRDYRDFEYRMDFKIGRMCNSGLFLRGDRRGGNPAFSGCEIQILDDFNWERVTNSKLAPYQFTGGLYGSVPAGVRNALAPLGAWNTYRVRYVGTRIRVELNGHELYDVDTLEVPGKPPFAERAPRGFIGLQRHAPEQARGDYAWFRNIWIREIPEKAK